MLVFIMFCNIELLVFNNFDLYICNEFCKEFVNR